MSFDNFNYFLQKTGILFTGAKKVSSVTQPEITYIEKNETGCCPVPNVEEWDENTAALKKKSLSYAFYTSCHKRAKYYGKNYTIHVCKGLV